jgi:hypothetical protein
MRAKLVAPPDIMYLEARYKTKTITIIIINHDFSLIMKRAAEVVRGWFRWKAPYVQHNLHTARDAATGGTSATSL